MKRIIFIYAQSNMRALLYKRRTRPLYRRILRRSRPTSLYSRRLTASRRATGRLISRLTPYSSRYRRRR